MNRDTQSVLDSIRRIVRALRISSCAAERELGLSSAQIYVLQKLKPGEGVSLNELAERTLTHQSSVSVVVGKLVERGLVVRKKSASDGRQVEISLTDEGTYLVRKAPEPLQKRLIDAIEALPEKKRAILSETLGTVVGSIDVDGGPAPLFFEEK